MESRHSQSQGSVERANKDIEDITSNLPDDAIEDILTKEASGYTCCYKVK